MVAQTNESAAWIEERPGPLLFVRIPEKYTDDEFISQLDELSTRIRAANSPLLLLIDVKMKSRSRPSSRERAKRFFREEKALLKTKIKAGALVSENAAIRGAIAAVSLVGLFPFSAKTFDDATLAERWLQAR